jgi:hypothetical protein
MENFETENSEASNDTPRIMNFGAEKVNKRNPENESEQSIRKTIDQNDTVPLRPSLKRI